MTSAPPTALTTTREDLWIGGGPVPPAGRNRATIIDPATEEEVGHCVLADPADVDDAVRAARDAFDNGPWPRLAVPERASVLRRAAALYRERAEELAGLITTQMGAPITLSRGAQVQGAAAALDYYAALGQDVALEEHRTGDGTSALVVQEPVGVVAAIAPWNFPQMSLMIKVAPALLAGCTVIAKPAEETPLDAFVLAEVLAEAGLPDGAFNVVPADRATSELLVRHPGVDKVSFTGSTAAGRRIAELCGADVRRCTLELGGKSAAILLDDVDLQEAITGLRPLTLSNTGQVCTHQTRLLLPSDRYDEMVEALATFVDSHVVGDPRDPATELGPVVSRRQQQRVLSYLDLAPREGRVVAGGGRPAGHDRGWYVEPTLVADVDPGARLAQEEIFGPVLVAMRYRDVDDAVAIANGTPFGLAGSVWSSDLDRGLTVARRIRAGMVRLNGHSSGLGAPFGGFKQSGIGRELGPEGLSAFLEPKTIPVPVGWAPRTHAPAGGLP